MDHTWIMRLEAPGDGPRLAAPPPVIGERRLWSRPWVRMVTYGPNGGSHR